MTEITKPKTTRVATDKGRVLLAITIYPSGLIGFREKGSKREYTINSLTCYGQAVKMAKGSDQ